MDIQENLVEVKESDIHGKGIFAVKDIPAGTPILIIEGEVIDEKECIRREEEEGNVYIFWNGDSYIDTVNTTVIKYINHDCDCNCQVLDNDEESLLLSSLKDIKTGDEITIDYGYDEIYDSCNCKDCSADANTPPE